MLIEKRYQNLTFNRAASLVRILASQVFERVGQMIF